MNDIELRRRALLSTLKKSNNLLNEALYKSWNAANWYTTKGVTYCRTLIYLKPNTTYTISRLDNSNCGGSNRLDLDSAKVTMADGKNGVYFIHYNDNPSLNYRSRTFTTKSGGEFRLSFVIGSTDATKQMNLTDLWDTAQYIMLNEGSEPLPYEPYI